MDIDRNLWAFFTFLYMASLACLYIQVMLTLKANKYTTICISVSLLSALIMVQAASKIVPDTTIHGIAGMLFAPAILALFISSSIIFFLPLIQGIYFVKAGFFYNLASYVLSLVTAYSIWNSAGNEKFAALVWSMWVTVFAILLIRKWHPSFFKETLP